MSTIDQATLARLSKLSNIDIPDNQQNKLGEDLSAIVSFIDKLSEANTDGVTPLRTTLELSDTPVNFREDVVSAKDEREKFQAIAPEVADGLYLVPEVIE